MQRDPSLGKCLWFRFRSDNALTIGGSSQRVRHRPGRRRTRRKNTADRVVPVVLPVPLQQRLARFIVFLCEGPLKIVQRFLYAVCRTKEGTGASRAAAFTATTKRIINMRSLTWGTV
ncbi:hypothetical protein EVAR_3588_1 [Eumeta japonica]|uniref:Uncharacterized protein n=1 Tax=Eumeta variegata TaxID=151549 RepID=A0A4C1SY98_EUMVA|nr:hypothetical protein EVAR_3588_1 [Eumeta japonica]